LRDALARVSAWAGDAATRQRCRRHVAAYSVQAAAQGIARAYSEVSGEWRMESGE
jgi:hypothetical protein